MNVKIPETMRKFQNVCKILEKYDYKKSKLIPILQEVQDEYRYLPDEVMQFIATSLHTSPSSVYGVATFYTHFAFKPKGKYVIKICDGTACHVKRSIPILEAIQKHLGLSEENNTTSDLMFTLETVSCLGACGLAPVIVINEDIHGSMTPEKTINIIEAIQKKESIKEEETCA
ncbi:MAG: NADH-quinone oxidoreductase subunit NuoE [Candidatus Muiribacteriota bacterium]